MRDAPKVSSKQNKTPFADVAEGDMVPHEDTYKFELLKLLSASLPPTFTTTMEMNGPSGTKADIVVGNPETRRVVVELVAHERDKPVTRLMEHIARCGAMYSQIAKVGQTWVVNFTTRQPNKDKAGWGYVWSTHERVSIIHVWHDLEWKTAKITELEDGDMKTTTLNLE